VARKREVIEDFSYKIQQKHDVKKLSQIFSSKIYPSNMQTVVLVAARQIMEEEHFRRSPQPTEATCMLEAGALEEALGMFNFKGSKQAVLYGPVRSEENIFNGGLV
jgi:hypothetical protein